MTEAERHLLKTSIDQVLVLTTREGDHLAQILFVFDEGDTPDLFYLEVEANPDGTFTPKGTTGHSLLLADILAAHRLA